MRADPKKPEDLAGLKTKPFAFEVATFASCVYGPADPSGAMDLSPTGLPRAQIRDPYTPRAPSLTQYS